MLLYNEGSGGVADPNMKNLPAEKYPLWSACMRGYLSLVCVLLENNADPNLSNEDGHLIMHVHNAGQHEVVRLLLEYGGDPGVLAGIHLNEVCALGYTEVATELSHKASPDEIKTCITQACRYGFPETALAIIINIKDIYVQKGCYAIVQQTMHVSSVQHLAPTPVIRTREDSPLWQSFHDNDMELLKTLLNEGHDPNTKNHCGQPLLHAYLQRKNTIAVSALCDSVKTDINQKDQFGRNALFYCLDWPPAYVRGKEVCMFDHLIAHKAVVSVDYFGRTILHEWAPLSNSNGMNLSLSSITKHVAIDCPENKQQTALHIGVLTKKLLKVKQLLAAGSDPNAQDVNGISPFTLARKDPDLYKLFTAQYPELQQIPEQIPCEQDVPCEVRHAHFSKDVTAEQRVVAALEEMFNKTNLMSSSHLFRERFETPMRISRDPAFKGEFKSFCSSVEQFMRDLGEVIGEEDPLFAFKPSLTGSCSEGTKVIEMNEADCACLFQHPDWKDIVLTNHEANNHSYMKVESAKLAKEHPDLFNKEYLSVHGVFSRFYSLIRKNIAKVLEKHKNLYVVDVDMILHNEYAICPLNLVWSGRVLKWQEFGLDVVPAFPVSTDKVPGTLNHHDLVHDLFIVPKWTSCLIEEEYRDEAFQLGFAHTEKDLFYAMPASLRQGYMLAKVALQKCMVIDEIPAHSSVSSYMLKCKAFECFTETKEFKDKLRNCKKRNLIGDEFDPPQRIIDWADKILAKVEQGIAEQYIGSFFLRGSNLIGHHSYKNDYRPALYVRICRAMLHSPSDNQLPMTRLLQAVTNQLTKPENLQKEAFVQEVSKLKEMGLSMNHRCENGCTLANYMIKQGLKEGLQRLLEWQATLEEVDSSRRSALEVASEFGQTDVEELLEKKSGKLVIRNLKLSTFQHRKTSL